MKKKLKIFELVYHSGIAYMPKAEMENWLKQDPNVQSLPITDQQKIIKACQQYHYPPDSKVQDDALWKAMGQLDPVLQFERNSEGPAMRVSLLLELMKVYQLTVQQFIDLWLSNPKNAPSDDKEIMRMFGY